MEENRSGCFAGVFQAATSADFIVTISQHTRRDFLGTFPHYPSDRVKVLYGASRFDAQAEARQPEAAKALRQGSFWLTVGTLEPRKNYLRLLQAFAGLRSRLKTTLPLVIVGGDGWLTEEFFDALRESEVREQVILLGRIPDPELVWLYRNCFCLVYPSLYEGFGLPIVEAMSQGAPIISSLGSSLEEVVGSAGLLIDPYDVDAISNAMEKLATGELVHEELGRRSLLRAGEFSWHAAASALVDIYHQVQQAPRLFAPDPTHGDASEKREW
jgi:glycosyltransferase involved in cell wall biosynthesis